MARSLNIGIWIFVLGYIYFPSSSGHKNLVYLFAFIPTCYFLCTRRYIVPHPKAYLLHFFVAIYLSINVLWSASLSWSSFSRYFLQSILLILTFWMILLAVINKSFRQRTLVNTCLLVGAGFCTYAIYRYFTEFIQPDYWPRLGHRSNIVGQEIVDASLGRFTSPIRLGSVCGVLALMGLYRFFYITYYRSMINIPMVILFISTLLLTKSRGPLMALILSAVILSLVFRANKSKTFLSLGVIVLAGLILGLLIKMGHPVLSRTFHESHRLIIWQEVVSQIGDHLIFGQGIREDRSLYAGQRDYEHSHNCLLSTVRYSGVVGGVLILTQFILTIQVALRSKNSYSKLWLVIMVFGMLAGLTNGAYMLSKLKEDYFLYWIPMAFIWANKTAAGLSGRGCERGGQSAAS